MRTVSSALLLCFAGACSSAPDSDGTAALTVDTLPAATAATFCHALFTCPVTGDDAGYRAVFIDEASCRAGYVRSLGGSFTDLQALVRAGSVRFDGAAARRCIDAVTSSCDLRNNDPSCGLTFVGTLAVGASCYRAEQCAGDAWCDHGEVGTGTPTCPGTCRARAALGAACTAETQCTRAGVQGEAYCTFDPTDSRCVEHRDTFTATEGQSCGAVATAGNVETVTNCQPGLRCDRSAAPGQPAPELGTCRRPIAVGAACRTSGLTCAGIARCVPTTADGTAGTCQATTVQNQAGAPCDAMRVCNPAQHLACQGGTCQAAGTGDVGTPCNHDLGPLICNPGLYCQSGGADPSSTCQRQIAEGMPCAGNDSCVSGSCSGSPAVCQAHVCR